MSLHVTFWVLTDGILDYPGEGETIADAAMTLRRKDRPRIAAEMTRAGTMGKGMENAADARRGVGKRIAESAPSTIVDGRKVTGRVAS